MHDVRKRENRERERNKSVSFFFPSSSNGNACFRVSDFFSLSFSLLLFFTIMCSLFLSFSRSLARFLRARQLSKMETFIPFYLLFLTHNYSHTAYTHNYTYMHTHTQKSCAKWLIYFVHCLICLELQAPGDISFCRRGNAANMFSF